MPRSSPFVVPVGEMLRHPGRARPVRIETSVDWAVEFFSARSDPPLRADLGLTAIPGGIVIRGPVELTIASTCVRCLTETHRIHRVKVDQLAEIVDEGDDGYVLAGDMLDLEPIIRDEVLLALPLLARCDPPCRGLGEDPETGLNTAAPGRRSESPFAILRDMLDAGD